MSHAAGRQRSSSAVPLAEERQAEACLRQYAWGGVEGGACSLHGPVRVRNCILPTPFLLLMWDASSHEFNIRLLLRTKNNIAC